MTAMTKRTGRPEFEQSSDQLRRRAGRRSMKSSSVHQARPAFPPRLSDRRPVHRAACSGVLLAPRSNCDAVHRPLQTFRPILSRSRSSALLGIAQTLVILTAGIDLSVGVDHGAFSVVMGRLAVTVGVPVADRLSARSPCRRRSAACSTASWSRGCKHAAVHRHARHAGSIFGALNTCYSQSETIRQQDIEAKAPFLQIMGKPIAHRRRGIICGLGPRCSLLAAIVWYVLNRTAFGRHVYATGDDPEAARLAGINTDRMLLSVYVARRPHLRRSPAGC